MSNKDGMLHNNMKGTHNFKLQRGGNHDNHGGGKLSELLDAEQDISWKATYLVIWLMVAPVALLQHFSHLLNVFASVLFQGSFVALAGSLDAQIVFFVL